jgi:hypothetical protein
MANGRSASAMDFVLRRAGTYVPELPVITESNVAGCHSYCAVTLLARLRGMGSLV